MVKAPAGVQGPDAPKGKSGQGSERDSKWRTGITLIEPNKILVRGYPLDELMGRVSFAEAIYLLLIGELPTPAIGRLLEAVLVSSIDHGATPPSTLAACNVATTGAPLRASVAAGVLAFGTPLGGGGASRPASDFSIRAWSSFARTCRTKKLPARCSSGSVTRVRARLVSATASTRATLARPDSFRWHWSSSWTGHTFR